jgi:hypothetical protein
MRRLVREGFLKKFAEYGAFVQWLVLVLQRGNQPSRIEIQQRLWFVIRVNLDVLCIGSVSSFYFY